MLGNGLGPWWFPEGIRRRLTNLGKRFFEEASWEIHDESYALRSPPRNECDRGFLKAMLRDASLQETMWKIFVCCFFAWFIWSLVRMFGWLSYNKSHL